MQKRQYSKHYAKKVLKVSLIISVPSILVLLLYVINDWLDFENAIYAYVMIYCTSFLFIHPYVNDLLHLTDYVRELSKDNKGKTPKLSLLSDIPELSEAVNELHKGWEKKRTQLEGYIVESKIIFDTLPDIIFMLDEKMTVIRTNNAAHAIFGAHIYRKHLDKVITDSPELIDAIKETINGNGLGKLLEVVIPRERGDVHFMVNIERFPIISSGNISVIVVMHNVSESKKTEKMFADFVANASHEIRTPLTSLIGFIETLRFAAKDDHEAREKFLPIMHEQAERMGFLIKELLSLSNIERSVNTVPTDKIEINEVIEGVTNQIQWQLEQKNMQLLNNISANIPRILGDYNQLVQVFTNLIMNAIKYSRKDTKITLTSQVLDEDEENNPLGKHYDSVLAIRVSDQGEGIAKEHLERLTERFYRVDRSRSRRITGNGLGLSIVKHIMKRHKGAMSVDSELGKGSTFSVYFPIK